MTSSTLESNVQAIEALSNQALTDSCLVTIKPQGAISASADTAFNGSIGDLKKKFPEAYDKLVVQSIGYQICKDCQRGNERFLEEMKRHRKDG